ncbi:MAG TPA: DNA-directed RNA polymerase subunit N [Thermoplasmata archaeon]|nr:DNA-directed RNA polymerase subunit N [Thermoplasmata archaeon]
MIIPVRCFTCGKVIAQDYEVYKNRLRQGEHPKDILDDLGIERVCCRRIFLSHPYDKETDKEPIDEAIHY